jgi:hypothetical protein
VVLHVCIYVYNLEPLGRIANMIHLGIAFCDPACPFCPPGVMGNTNVAGEGEGDNDESSSESKSSTQTSASHTVLYGTDLADSFPTTFAAMADLSVSICFGFH